MGVADNLVAREFAAATQALLAKAGLKPADISAIGSRPDHTPPPATRLHPADRQCGLLAALTGIDVISDFSHPGHGLGGQGRPPVPAFHPAIFAKPGPLRVVLNLGGIANISVLPGHADGAPVPGSMASIPAPPIPCSMAGIAVTTPWGRLRRGRPLGGWWPACSRAAR